MRVSYESFGTMGPNKVYHKRCYTSLLLRSLSFEQGMGYGVVWYGLARYCTV